MTLSKITPYQTLIASLRKEGKSYREIVQILRENHGLKVARNTVHSFVKVRSKRPKKVYTMIENFEASSQTPAEPQKRLVHTAPARSGLTTNPTATGSSAVVSSGRKHSPFLKTFTPGNEYSLTRLSPEEKADFERELEREIELERQQAKSPQGD